MTPTYCPLPWVSLNILPGEVRPCCQWNGAAEFIQDVNALSKAEVANLFFQTKQDMLAGKKISGCDQCYFAESIGAKSRRQDAVEKYGFTTEVSTQILDITFDNICNLKCRGCCSFSSHMWYEDEIKIYGKPFIGKKYIEYKSESESDFSNLTHINISGGEPFLSKNVERFLNNIVNSRAISDVCLSIITNGTIRPSADIYNALYHAKELNLTVSIDAIGELNDYFRSGSDFKTILENLKYLDTLCKDSTHTIFIHTTVSIYNVTILKQIEDYFDKNYPHFKLEHRMLQWPEPLAIQNMPDSLKDVVRPIVESFGPKYNDVLEAINMQSKEVYGHFLNFHNTLDNLRNETLPNKLLSDYIIKNQVTVDSTKFFKQQIRG